MISRVPFAVSLAAALAVLAISPLQSASASTTPPDSSPPKLDPQRQALVDDMLTISELQGATSDRACVSELVAGVPDADLPALAAVTEQSMATASTGEASPNVADVAMTPEIVAFTIDSLSCLDGDADPEMVDAVIDNLLSRGDFVDSSAACLRGVLSVFPDEWLNAMADGESLDDVMSGASVGGAPADAQLALDNFFRLLLCSPQGAEMFAVLAGVPPPTTG